MAGRIPILEYHDLGAETGEKRSFHSPYVLDPKIFRAQLQWLSENDFQTISIDDLFCDAIPEKSVILTFDDGHISNYEQALPVLKEFGFQATFFLVARSIGRENHLTGEHIQEMQEAGMHFGSHSLTHPYLLTLDKKAMMYEISESKVLIEKVIKKEIHHFCIPFGFFNKALFRYAKEAGYKSVLTERMGYFSPDQKPFKVLPRFIVKADMPQSYFVDIMSQRWAGMMSQYLFENLLHGAKTVLGCKGYLRLKSLLVQSSK